MLSAVMQKQLTMMFFIAKIIKVGYIRFQDERAVSVKQRISQDAPRERAQEELLA
jgi:hypothetical protein